MRSAFESTELERFRRLLTLKAGGLRARCDQGTAARVTNFMELAGGVHDAAEEATAELALGLETERLEREMGELHDVEAALERIAGGHYGMCIHCHRPIDMARLNLFPTAKRCVECQQRYEHSRVDVGNGRI